MKCTQNPSRVLGSRHSFNAIADSTELICLDDLRPDVKVDHAAGTVGCAPGVRYGELASVLAALQAARVRCGYVGTHAPYEPGVVASFWSFTAGATAIAWVAFALLPLAFAR